MTRTKQVPIILHDAVLITCSSSRRILPLSRIACATKKRITPATSSNRCELDSHADTCVAGADTLLVAHDDRIVSVHAFSGEHAPINDVQIGTVATLWIHPVTGRSHILVTHEALYLGDRLPETLLNPNQIRANGLRVEGVPKQFDSTLSHAIHTKKRDVHISLSLDGVISGFKSRKPTWEEYEEHPRLELISNVKWKPSSKAFAKEERRHVSSTKRLATISEASPDNHFHQVAAVRAYHSSQHAVEFDDDLFGSLIDTVHAAPDDLNGDGFQGHLDDDIYPKTDDSSLHQRENNGQI
jgi:hypothetical protein